MSTCTGSVTITEENIRMVTNDMDEDEEEAQCTATVTSVSVRWGTLLKVRVVVSLMGKLVLPAVVGVYYACLRNKNTVLENVRRHLVPAILTFLANGLSKSVASVQGVVNYPTNKIDPILKVIKLKYFRIIELEAENITEIQDPPEKTVSCAVLSEPPEGIEAQADVVFIHGLHGSLVKTWKQGQWKMPKCLPFDNRRASTSALQEIKTADAPCSSQTQTLKRSSSICMGTQAKFAKDENGERLLCECGGDECECSMEEEPYTECWPKDWLPKDCPGVRVIGITYTTDPYLWRPVWIKKKSRTSMEERSSEMTEQLLQLGVGKKPIIWVGHSKGGLFVKQLLVDAWENSHDIRLAEMYKNTKAIMFYSVPHRGSSLADFSLPLIRKSVELLEIGKDCEKVLELHKKFLSVCSDVNPHIFSFIETSLTFMSFLYLRIVAIESAGMFEDITGITENLIALNAGIAALYITTCFANNREKIRELLKEMDKFKHYSGEEEVAKTDKQVAFLSKLFVTYGILGTLVYTTAPLLQIEECKEKRRHSKHSQHIPCGYVTRSIIPDNTFPYNVLIYLDQIYTCMIVSLFTVSVTALLCGVLMHLVTQIKFLKKKLLSSCQEGKSDDETEKDVYYCIQYHQMIIEFGGNLDKAFNTMMLMHLTITSLTISILGFEIIMVNSLSDSIRFGLHLGGWIILLFLACYYGQVLIDESISIGHIAYNTQWYVTKPSVQKDLSLMIIRAQRPLTLSANSLGIMSLEIFLKVMSSAYSYFTLLVNVKN